MRRGLPFALVGLVALATGIGAWLGLSTAPTGGSAQAWVSQVLATTQAAGTVRFTYTSVSTSSHPQSRSSASGSGAVDFADDAARSTENGSPRAWSNGVIRLGRTVYLDVAAPGQPRDGWINIGRPPDSSQGVLGLEYSNAGAALAGFSDLFHAVRVEDLGSNMVNGIPATGYRVTTEPTCASSRSGHLSVATGPTEVWVDGDGRLVQVHSTVTTSVEEPTGTPPTGQHPEATATTTGVIRFSGYGEPVTITAPPLSPDPRGQSVSAIAVSSVC
jgi:hypothetical protein